MKNWKKLIFTHGIKEIVNLFSQTFLGIYIFKITNGSILTVALYYLVYYLSHIIWRYIISRYINTKNVVKIYRFAIFTNLIVALILMIFKTNILNYIYIFAVIYAFSQCLYWTSYEIIINDLNDSGNLKKYFTYDSVLNNISNLIFPLTFGVIIEKYSYVATFAIIVLIAFVSLIMSLNFRYFEVNCNKINILRFFKNIKNKKIFRLMTMQCISDGLTNGGIAQLLTTILIFNKISSEFLIGSISSILSVVCIIVAIIAERKINYNNYKKIVLPITILFFIITIPISLKTTLILVIIYKIILEICNVLTNVEGNALTFKMLKYICDKDYKVDYLWYQELTLNTGRAIGLLLIVFITYFTDNINYLYILLIMFSIFLIIRTLVIIEIQKELNNKEVLMRN